MLEKMKNTFLSQVIKLFGQLSKQKRAEISVHLSHFLFTVRYKAENIEWKQSIKLGRNQGFVQKLNTYFIEAKPWSSGRVLGSWLKGCKIDPRPMLDWSGVKAMPGSIPAPNPGSFNVSQMGHT